MTTLNITIDLDNDAFQDLNGQNEVARILTRYSKNIIEWGIFDDVGLKDANGNTVGTATLTRKEDDS